MSLQSDRTPTLAIACTDTTWRTTRWDAAFKNKALLRGRSSSNLRDKDRGSDFLMKQLLCSLPRLNTQTQPSSAFKIKASERHTARRTVSAGETQLLFPFESKLTFTYISRPLRCQCQWLAMMRSQVGMNWLGMSRHLFFLMCGGSHTSPQTVQKKVVFFSLFCFLGGCTEMPKLPKLLKCQKYWS